MTNLRHDLKNALRQLARRPAMSGLIVLILALGIGANTAIFTLADAALFKGLPVAEPDRLVRLFTANDRTRTDYSNASMPQFRDLQRELTAFDSMAAFTVAGVNVAIGNGMAERIAGAVATANFFDLLGVRPHLGRLLGPMDNEAINGHPVVVVSHHFWRTRLDASRDAIGRRIRINSEPMTVVGIAPAGFGGVDLDNHVDIWVPASMAPTVFSSFMTTERMEDYGTSWLNMIGRLAPEATLAQARAEADARALNRLEELGRVSGLPQGQGPWLKLVHAREAAVDAYATESTERNAWFLTAVVVLVLLLACANVTGLLVVRGEEREREIAVRLSLGATRARIFRLLLTECAMLAAAGAVVGLLVAHALLRWVAAEAPAGVILPLDPATAVVDGRALAFTAICSIGTVLLAGVAPALRGARTAIATTLKGVVGHATASGARTGWRSGLVVVQVGISVVLLLGAALMLQSFWKTATVDPGFRAEGVALVNVNLGRHGTEASARQAMFDRIADRVGALPGVEHTAWSVAVPIRNAGIRSTIDVDNPNAPKGSNANVDLNIVSPGYFETLSIPILSGRVFEGSEQAEARGGVLVNQALAETFWPGENALGKQIHNMPHEGDQVTVVGIVGNNKQRSLREADRPILYIPPSLFPVGAMTLVARTGGNAASLLPTIRQTITELDPLLPVTRPRTLEDQLGASYGQSRLFSWLLASFAGLSLLLAAAGLYGVLAYSMRARTREIGIRMALGASRERIVAMVLRHTGWLVAAGVLIGLACALAATRIIESLLFEVAPRDPLTAAGVVGLVLLVALGAAWLPLRRAMGVDPAQALRDE